MLPMDGTKRISFQRPIANGDLVIVYERHDNMKAIKVCEDSELQNRYGVFKHSDWIGKPFGSKVMSNKNKFVYLLAPTPELWTLVLSHRTQILYIADISFVVSFLEIVPGCVVLESGTGSGSLTTSLARAVSPTGHVYTFDFHEQRAASAREDFENTGLSNLVTVGVRDIQDIRTFEILLRTYEVRERKTDFGENDNGGPIGSLPCKRKQVSSEIENGRGENCSSTTIMARPNAEAKGHTGYLTFARLKCLQ